METQFAPPFVISPPPRLLEEYAELQNWCQQISLKYVHRDLLYEKELIQLGRALWGECLNLEKAFRQA